MDLLIKDTGDGGELTYENMDLTVKDGLQNQVYLALFGGNVGFLTPFERRPNEQNFDFWANSFLEEGQRFDSRTEYALDNNSLSSSGRAEIEKAVKKDLGYMSDFANLSVNVTIDNPDRLSILVTVLEPANIEDREFRFIWNATKQELE